MAMPTPEQVTRLQKVFDLVQDKPNWKQSIDNCVLAHQATDEEIIEAVVFFAGCVPTVTSCQVPVHHPQGLVSFMADAWHVKAVGYYAAVGA